MKDAKGLSDIEVSNITRILYYGIKRRENCRRNSLYFLL